MSFYRQLVKSAFEALRIETPTSFSWYGEPVAPLPAEAIAQMGAEVARAYLRDRLRDHLYGSFYCTGRAVPQQANRTAIRPHGASAFIDSLSRANRGTGSCEAGWKVVRTEGDGRLVVRRHGLSLWVRPEEVLGQSTGPDAEVSVRMPSELLRLSPGFYMALGNQDLGSEESFVRHYWHLSSHGGEALVAAGTRLFNEAGLPFRLKVLIDPDLYSRCDAGVLYTPKRLGAEVAELLPPVRDAVAGHLRPGTPALTKPLGEGLGVAEDPPGGDSFGMDRCGLLAEAMVRAFELGRETGEERLALVEETFGERGVAFERPYLNADSADEYEPVR
jgi:HopA1 effector protein family